MSVFLTDEPMGAIHIIDRSGLLLCGFVNPAPKTYGLMHAGINVATCRRCVRLFTQSQECPPLCRKCGCFHHESGAVCAILHDIFAGYGAEAANV
jgi:hypothetical protein